MKNLQLVAKTKEQEKIKAYLEENVSDIFAAKINKGIQIEVVEKYYIPPN